MSDRELFTGVLPFVQVARARTFREAARQLGVTPSAISKAVSRLESELGVRLLRRTARRVTLTAEGESFLRGCETAVEQMRTVRAQVSLAQRSVRGPLVVSAPLLLGAEVIMPALGRLCARHPALSVRCVLTDRPVDLVREGVDAVVRIGEVADSQLTKRALRRVRWLTVAAPSYLARSGVPLAVDQLGHHDCLAFVDPDGRPKPFAFASGEYAPRARLMSDHGESLIRAACAGQGIFQAHDYAVQPALARGELVEVLAGENAEGPPLSLLYVPGRSPGKLRAFADLIVELLGDSPRRNQPIDLPNDFEAVKKAVLGDLDR